MNEDPHAKARILAEALPYMQRYSGETLVIKYGGHAMGDQGVARGFAQDVVLLRQAGVHPVVVHGGGPQIGAMLDRLQIKSAFAEGLRITDHATVEIVEMVLAGSINKQLTAIVNSVGGQAVGLSGKDAGLLVARKATRTVKDPDSHIERVVDLGFVGEPEAVNRAVLDVLIRGGFIPVVAPVAFGRDGETYNVNADTFAGAVAGALGARRLLLLTDVPGVLDRDKRLIKELTIADCRALMAQGVISGGMIPKVETCVAALEQGVEAVVIVDGRVPHAVLLELLTDHGAGTLIRRG